MKIVWFTWKDLKHPLAGGAEVVNEELARRLVKDGHEVILLVGGFKDAKPKEVINGYTVIRLGNRFSLYWHAYRYYKKHLKGWPNLIIEEINTIPFFTKFYVKERNLLFVHQLARKIWFYQIFFPLNLAGYLLEPLYLRMLSDRKVITVSDSTKRDLMKYGFKEYQIQIISEGIKLTPLKDLNNTNKYLKPTILSLGSIRPMKRTLDQIKAFEIAKNEIANLQIKVAGDYAGLYGKKVINYINDSKFKKDIEVLGVVTTKNKVELLQKAHLILVTSVKEGWGLVVTEANSQGTPAVVYDVDGLRDSVKDLDTGLISPTSPVILAEKIVILLQDSKKYDIIANSAHKWSSSINFKASYRDFKNLITDK